MLLDSVLIALNHLFLMMKNKFFLKSIHDCIKKEKSNNSLRLLKHPGLVPPSKNFATMPTGFYFCMRQGRTSIAIIESILTQLSRVLGYLLTYNS